MLNTDYQPGESYAYPLIIKKLLNTPLINSPRREIVYSDQRRYTYQTLNERIWLHRHILSSTRTGSSAPASRRSWYASK